MKISEEDITGIKFGRLLAIDLSHRDKKGRPYWNCICDCGNKRVVDIYSLKSGRTKSCSCLQKEKASNSAYNKSHGMSFSPTYKSWESMYTRCTNPKSIGWKNYGGRGIKLSKRWMTFSNFLEDMGERPEGKTLDRIDVNGNYCKENCRWSTPKHQGNNRRNNRRITHEGETKTVAEWADKMKVNRQVLLERFKMGWSVERTLTTPVRELKQRVTK